MQSRKKQLRLVTFYGNFDLHFAKRGCIHFFTKPILCSLLLAMLSSGTFWGTMASVRAAELPDPSWTVYQHM